MYSINYTDYVDVYIDKLTYIFKGYHLYRVAKYPRHVPSSSVRSDGFAGRLGYQLTEAPPGERFRRTLRFFVPAGRYGRLRAIGSPGNGVSGASERRPGPHLGARGDFEHRRRDSRRPKGRCGVVRLLRG